MEDCSTFSFLIILFSLQNFSHNIFIAFSLKAKSGDLGNRMLFMHLITCSLDKGICKNGIMPLLVSLKSRRSRSGKR